MIAQTAMKPDKFINIFLIVDGISLETHLPYRVMGEHE